MMVHAAYKETEIIVRITAACNLTLELTWSLANQTTQKDAAKYNGMSNARFTTGYHQATRSFKIKKNWTDIHQAASTKVKTPMIETPAFMGMQRQHVKFSVFLLLHTHRQQQHSLRLSSFSS